MGSVPYHCQWQSRDLAGLILSGRMRASADPAWRGSGATDPLDYEFWSWRSCGLACLKMVLDAMDVFSPPVVTLAKEAFSGGAFVKSGSGLRGLIYRPFVHWVEDTFEVSLVVFEHQDERWVTRRVAEGALVIASVHPAIRDALGDGPSPGRGGHLVLVTGAVDGGLRFHNPSGSTRENQEDFLIPGQRFGEYFARRGMVLTR